MNYNIFMLTIAISSRSLFNLETSNEIFERDGQAAYDRHMLDNEKKVLEPGVAFTLVSKLLALNTPGKRDRVEVVMLSRNSAASSLRIMSSIRAHGLNIERAVFTSGENRFRYAQQYGADLFLSATGVDTHLALQKGIAAATIAPGAQHARVIDEIGDEMDDKTVRIAFDGDAVIFSDEADAVFRASGLQSFIDHENEKEHIPLGEGPFRRLVQKLLELRTSLPEDERGRCRLRIGLVTARGIESSGRVMNTLRTWGLSLDELVFAGGSEKGPLLKAMGADFFFDDTGHNVRSSNENNIPAAQVPFGAGGIVAPHGLATARSKQIVLVEPIIAISGRENIDMAVRAVTAGSSLKSLPASGAADDEKYRGQVTDLSDRHFKSSSKRSVRP